MPDQLAIGANDGKAAIHDLLKSLTERRVAKSESADRRLLALQREVSDAEDRLKRIYRSTEDGIVELDDILRERTAALKSGRERAKAALDRARAQRGTFTMVDAQKIDAFSRLSLDSGDTNTRRVTSVRSSRHGKSMIRPSGSSEAMRCSIP